MSIDNFKARYTFDNPLPTDDELMFAEGFQRYQPLGKIWAHVVTQEEMALHFEVVLTRPRACTVRHDPSRQANGPCFLANDPAHTVHTDRRGARLLRHGGSPCS